MIDDIHPGPVRAYLEGLQDRITAAFEEADGQGSFARLELPGERGGLARPRVLEGGALFERAAVNFSLTRGKRLPEAASARRPELAGRRYEAVSVSVITHPANPYVPTSHMNVRFFLATRDPEPAVFWFGGGFDLTPYYLFDEDTAHWHAVASAALAPHGEGLYPRFSRACDDYFFLPHREEARGIGGLFFDDFAEGGFERAFGVLRAVGDAYLPAYLPIVDRRRERAYGERERAWQLYRRGRYVEFNLLYDRGTRFGLAAGGRTESILASLPPLVRFSSECKPVPNSEEARLLENLSRP